MDNSKICTKKSDVRAAISVASSMTKSVSKHCQSPCNTMQVSVLGNNVVGEGRPGGKPQVRLFFQSKVMIGREEYLYNFLSFFAEVGGYVGLILGFSLLNLTQLVITALEKMISKIHK